MLRVYIEQNYLPSLRLEKKTTREYRDTWNLRWNERIRDLAFGQLYPDVAFRLLKEIADQDDISKTTLQHALVESAETVDRIGGCDEAVEGEVHLVSVGHRDEEKADG